MFLFMGQTSVIVADEKSSWNPLNFNRGHNSKMENVNFNEFMTLKIDLDNASINCFFGYQDGNRIVLCF